MSSVAATLAELRRPEELYDLLDPDVMWYSTDVDSSCTCNDKDEAVACIERNLEAGLTGRFDVLRENDDVVVVRVGCHRTSFGGVCSRSRDSPIPGGRNTSDN